MYKGLVIGGELDGQILEHHDNMYRIEREPGTWKVLYRPNGTPSLMQPHKYIQYLFVSRYWLPYDTREGARPITDALETLERVYIEAKQRKAD